MDCEDPRHDGNPAQRLSLGCRKPELCFCQLPRREENSLKMKSVQPLRIVIPGGSGQVGNILARHFHSRGDSVVVLSRTTFAAPWRMVPWDGVNLRSWVRELEKADVLINLTGRSVNCRYNDANRRKIMESRTQSTRVLGKALNQIAHPPRLWMNASTATIYRHAFDRPMDEFTGE